MNPKTRISLPAQPLRKAPRLMFSVSGSQVPPPFMQIPYPISIHHFKDYSDRPAIFPCQHRQYPVYVSPRRCMSNLVTIGPVVLEKTHFLKLEQSWNRTEKISIGPCARMTRKFVKRSIFSTTCVVHALCCSA